MKHTIFSAIAACALLLSMTACQEDTTRQSAIFLSVDSYTFQGNGLDTLQVRVTTDGGWDFNIADPWVQSLDQTDTSIRFAAIVNTDDISRRTSVTFTSADGLASSTLTLSQLTNSSGFIFEEPMDLAGCCISRDGSKLAGIRSEIVEGNTWSYDLVVKDLVNGTEEITHLATGLADVAYDQVWAITNDGNTIVIANCMGGISSVISNGEFVDVAIPAESKMVTVRGVSEDGTIWVGDGNSSGDSPWYRQPIRWVNGTPEILERPETDSHGNELRNGTYVRGCSEDGSVIYGSEWSTFGLVYWVNGKLTHISKDICAVDTVTVEIEGKEYMGISYSTLVMEGLWHMVSPNGRYIAAAYDENGFDEYLSRTSVRYPSIVDTQTGEVTILREHESCQATAVTNEGNIFFSLISGAGAEAGYFYDAANSSAITLAQWFSDNFGLTVTESRFVEQISCDGKTLTGQYPLYMGGTGTTYLDWYFKQL